MHVTKTALTNSAILLYGDLNDLAGFLRAKQSVPAAPTCEPDASGDIVVTRAVAARLESLSVALATLAAQFRPVSDVLAAKLANDASRLGQDAGVLASLAGARCAYGRGWDSVLAQPIATLLEATRAALAHE